MPDHDKNKKKKTETGNAVKDGKIKKYNKSTETSKEKRMTWDQYKTKHGTSRLDEAKSWSKANPAKETKSINVSFSDIAQPGKPGKPGTMIDKMTPTQRRRSNREEKVALRQERQMGKKTSRAVSKGIKKGLIKSKDTVPGTKTTYGQVGKNADMNKIGLGQSNLDRSIKPKNYKDRQGGSLYSADHRSKVEYGGVPKNPTKATKGTPFTEATPENIKKYNAVKAEDIQGQKLPLTKNRKR